MEFLETNTENISNSNKSVSKTGLFLISVTGGLGLTLSIICLPFVSPAFRKVCLPYVPATTQQIKNVLQALQGRSGTLIDLGSGDGRLVLAAAKKNFMAYGVELNLWLLTYSRIVAFAQRLSSNAVFYREDLWKHNLSRYDNVILFGVQEMMEKIENKFIKELKNDCRIVVCRFPLPNLTPVKIVGSGIDTVWIYSKPISSLDKK
ncbi:ATP synthase subunit C lysine N-methyltransferase [Chelonus insularis]|uniref:ATP synthase subunit C lysine N-methyltransferase n=1 Tax=Chelonus insularis TaxID=460826 RepID=UPI00158F3586|nr:ATP synthase subunit C lysine N-methyltransferase [Chelonus insularis]